MPTAAEHLAKAYPFLVDSADPRYVSEEVMAWAMAVAEGFRPQCLPEDQQNLAQAHYTAYLLAARVAAPSTFGTVSSGAGKSVAGPIIERQEGDTRVRYADGGSGSSGSSRSGADTGPAAPYAAWRALAEMCGPVAGTDPAATPRYRGGIITRFGNPA